ncbi:MAG: hypothetical protein EOO65_05805, partial [Methanosarcinales archaeon]
MCGLLNAQEVAFRPCDVGVFDVTADNMHVAGLLFAWQIVLASSFAEPAAMLVRAEAVVGASINCTLLAAPVPCDVQEVALLGVSNAAQVRLQCAHRGHASPLLPGDVKPSTLAQVLAALPSIAAPVVVSSQSDTAGTVWRIAFPHGDASVASNLPLLACQLVADNVTATRSARITVRQVNVGAAPTLNGELELLLPSFSLNIPPQVLRIPVNANDTQLMHAFRSLTLPAAAWTAADSAQARIVNRVGSSLVRWAVTFSVLDEDVPLMVATSENLTGVNVRAAALTVSDGLPLERWRVSAQVLVDGAPAPAHAAGYYWLHAAGGGAAIISTLSSEVDFHHAVRNVTGLPQLWVRKH